MTDIHAERLFTGTQWITDVTVTGGDRIDTIDGGRSPSAVSYPLVLPGLIDVGVWAEGYLEGPTSREHPFVPEEAFIALCRSHGVTSVVDTGSSCSVGRWLIGQHEINAVSSLGRVSSSPTRRCDHVVDAGHVSELASALQTLGAACLVIAEPDAVDVSGISGPVVLTRERGGMTVPGFFVHRGDREWVSPQIIACSLWTVEGMLNGPDATLGRAFLPYLKHFAGEGNFMARRIARGVLKKLYGERRVEDLDGWPDAAIKSRPDSQLLASSGAGAAGVVPGLGLWDELAALERHIGFEAALRTATSNPAAAIPALNSGVIEPGARMDLLLCDGDAASIAELREHMSAIVVAGAVSTIQAEKESAQNYCLAADRRAL